MTLDERIELAGEEVTQAERMVAHTREELRVWQNRHELRTATLNALIATRSEQAKEVRANTKPDGKLAPTKDKKDV